MSKFEYERIPVDRPGPENPAHALHKEMTAKEGEAGVEEELNPDFLEILDIKPEKETSLEPVLMIPGYAATPKRIKKAMKELADQGQRVLAVNPPREPMIERGTREDAIKEHLQKAFNCIIALEQKGIRKVRIVGHSEGGIVAMLVAKILEEYNETAETVIDIVLVNTAGMIGKDDPWNLIKRFWSRRRTGKEHQGVFKRMKKIIPAVSLTRDFFSYVKKDFAMASREFEAIAASDISAEIEDLRKKGIRVKILSGGDDRIFPSKRVKEQILEEHQRDFHEVRGGHGNIIFNPEETMREVGEALRIMWQERAEKK